MRARPASVGENRLVMKKTHRASHRFVLLAAAVVIAALVVTGILLMQKLVPTTAATLEVTPSPVLELVERVTLAPTQTPLPTATPSPTPSPTPTPSPEPTGLIKTSTEMFLKCQGYERSESTYRSDAVSISVSKVVDNETYGHRLVYYVADIYVQDVAYLRTASTGGTFQLGTRCPAKIMCRDANALVAISGDFCGFHRKSFVVRNGEVLRTTLYPNFDVCALYADGVMEAYAYDDVDVDAILARNPWQVWEFGPTLLNADGTARTNFPVTDISPLNPRSVLGYYAPGHYCFVTVDGRQKDSKGLTLLDLAKLMESLGCAMAFNLDGGQSSHYYWNGAIQNVPATGGRTIGDIVYVVDDETNPLLYYIEGAS